MTEALKPSVSIIVPCFNEENFIANTVRLAFEQDYPTDQLELIVVDGESTDATSKILDALQSEFDNLRVLNNPNRTVPFAFNMAIPEAKGEIIVILGAHSEIPSHYVSTLVDHLLKNDAANVGGVLETLPANETSKARAIALACSSKIGMGDSKFRVGSEEVLEVDTVPFGCYKKSIFDEVGLFDTELTRNQDDEFNGRVTKAGGKILLVPSIRLKYFARSDYSKLYTMFYQYGLFKPLVGKKVGRPTTIRQLVPPVYVLSILISLLLGLLQPVFWLFLLLEQFMYQLLVLVSGLKMSGRFSISLLLHFSISVNVIHMAYGMGYIKGFVQFVLFGIQPARRQFKSSR